MRLSPRYRTFSTLMITGKQEETLKGGLNKYAKNGIPEIYVATLLTNHLLSCLVYGNQYLISNGYRKKPPLCPCSNNDCGKYITYGQTGVGKYPKSCL